MLANLATLGIDTKRIVRCATLGDARREQYSPTRTGNRIFLVVQGCDGRFWVMVAKDALKLERAGYELI